MRANARDKCGFPADDELKSSCKCATSASTRPEDTTCRYLEVVVGEFPRRRAGAHRKNVANELYRSGEVFELVCVLLEEGPERRTFDNVFRIRVVTEFKDLQCRKAAECAND